MTVLWIMGCVIGCMFVFTAVQSARGVARLRARVVLRHLDYITHQNLPLAAALSMVATGEDKALRRALNDTARLAAAGLSLSESLRRAYPACPGLLLSAIQSGEAGGTLPGVLRNLNDRLVRGGFRPRTTEFSNRWSFAAMSLLLMLLVATAIGYYTLPRIRTITEDFKIAPPPMTQGLLDALNPVDPRPLSGWALVIRAGLIVLTLTPPVFLLLMIVRMRPRRADHPGILTKIGDLVFWSILPLRRVASWRGMANAVPTLRLALAAGWDLPDAIDHAARLDANLGFRRQLQEWVRQIRGGRDAVAAARAAELPDMFIRCVAIGAREGNFDGPLRLAADYYDWLVRRFEIIVAQVLWPAVTLLLTGFGALLVTAIMLFIRAIIEHSIELCG